MGKNKAEGKEQGAKGKVQGAEGKVQGASEVFSQHNVEELYSTADGMIFISRLNAEAQASFLDDKTVNIIKREETE